MLLVACFAISACSNRTSHDHDHDHDGDHESSHPEEGHAHHEEISHTLIQYTDHWELFAEADPFVQGEPAEMLIHLTQLADFKPLNDSDIEISLTVGDKSFNTNGKRVQAGIYKCTVEPTKAGEGLFSVSIGADKIHIPVRVFADSHEPFHAFTEPEIPATAIQFTKEQSWKIDFATAMPQSKPFGQLIKATARVEALPAKTKTLTANANGLVQFASNGLVAGCSVSAGQQLFRIAGSGMGDDNAALVYQSALGDYELAKAEYERMAQLAEKQIVSQREFLQAQNRFSNAKAKYENLQQNFNASGQLVKAEQAGSLEKLWVKNGQYVHVGDALASMASYSKVQLVAGVQQKYAGALSQIGAVTYHSETDGWRNLTELNGRLLSVGTRAAETNFMVPVYLECDNAGDFLPGSFVELNFSTVSSQNQTVVPVAAIMEQQSNFFVFVQLNPELFEKRQVFPGSSNGLETVIERGLSANERIVTKGAVMLKLASASGTLDPHAGHVH